jgi:hypothetical protein
MNESGGTHSNDGPDGSTGLGHMVSQGRPQKVGVLAHRQLDVNGMCTLHVQKLILVGDLVSSEDQVGTE